MAKAYTEGDPAGADRGGSLRSGTFLLAIALISEKMPEGTTLAAMVQFACVLMMFVFGVSASTTIMIINFVKAPVTAT